MKLSRTLVLLIAFFFLLNLLIACLHLEMANWVLDRGPGPQGFGAGRVWAGDFMTRKIAGLAGWVCLGPGS